MKPGWQTTEFWISLVPSVWAALESSLPPVVRILVPTVASAVYTVARAITKAAASKGPAAPRTPSQTVGGMIAGGSL